MGRRISEKTITSKTARAELKARGKPYYRGVSAGLHLGYRKGRDAKRWVASTTSRPSAMSMMARPSLTATRRSTTPRR